MNDYELPPGWRWCPLHRAYHDHTTCQGLETMTTPRPTPQTTEQALKDKTYHLSSATIRDRLRVLSISIHYARITREELKAQLHTLADLTTKHKDPIPGTYTLFDGEDPTHGNVQDH